MRVQDASTLFHNFQFEKSSDDIIKAATRKMGKINAKIHEREERIVKIRQEYKITDAMLIDVMRQARQHGDSGKMSYSIPNSTVNSRGSGLTEDTVTIGAGVVNNLLTEQDSIEGEREQVKRLGFVIRNLTDLPHYSPTGTMVGNRGHRLSYVELEFLVF